jgi:NDP-sugar pyrophosphorylase family protein
MTPLPQPSEHTPKKAMIFAAGIGSRLKALTKDTPKCLMQVGGVAMLERVVERLKSVGVRSVVINVHHHAEQVIAFVESRHRFGIEVAFSHEAVLLDTGGGLKKVQELFANEISFFLHNADVYCESDLGELLSRHQSRGAFATLAVMTRDSQRGLFMTSAMELVGWTSEQAPPPANAKRFAFSGISICTPRIFSYMPDGDTFSIIEPLLTCARATHSVFGFEIDPTTWVDIGTPEQLAALQARFT